MTSQGWWLLAAAWWLSIGAAHLLGGVRPGDTAGYRRSVIIMGAALAIVGWPIALYVALRNTWTRKPEGD